MLGKAAQSCASAGNSVARGVPGVLGVPIRPARVRRSLSRETREVTARMAKKQVRMRTKHTKTQAPSAKPSVLG
jgi:hypothetical protein